MLIKIISAEFQFSLIKDPNFLFSTPGDRRGPGQGAWGGGDRSGQ